MNNALPHIPVSVARYYVVRLKINPPADTLPQREISMIMAQTEYAQLVIVRLTTEPSGGQPLSDWLEWQETIPMERVRITQDTVTPFNDFSELEVISLQVISDHEAGAIDLTPVIIDLFEVLYLFLTGAIQPGIQLLDYLLDSDISTVFPVRELFRRTLSDDLKINILAESQLLADPADRDDFIHISLVWFLGKTEMAGIDRYLQNMIEADDPEREELTSFYKPDIPDPDFGLPPFQGTRPYSDSGQASLTEAEQDLKKRFEEELKQFYTGQDMFFTRISGIPQNMFVSPSVKEGVYAFLSTPDTKQEDSAPLSLLVQTKDKQTIGFLKNELSDILLENIQKGYQYSAVITNVLSDEFESDNRVHVLIKRLTFQFN